MTVEWPAPTGYEFPPDLDAADNEAASVKCRDGRDLTGTLQHFNSEQLHLVRLAGEHEVLPLADIKYVRSLATTLMQPLDANLWSPDEPGFRPHQHSRFLVEFHDGERLEGQTIGSVTTPFGLYLYVDPTEFGRVRRIFVSAGAVAACQIIKGEDAVTEVVDRPMDNPRFAKMYQRNPAKYPYVLQERYMRILNRISDLWGNPDLDGYFEDLLIDRRGGRQGFPKEVLNDIMRLQVAHLDHMASKAQGGDIWGDPQLRNNFAADGLEFSQKAFASALESGNRKVVERFLDAGVNIDVPNDDGWTPLMVAAFNGREDVALLLIQRGAAINSRDDEAYSPLHWAAFNGYERVAALLIGKGAYVNAQNIYGWTPLLQASAQGHTRVVEWLVKFKASPNMADKEGWVPLHKAAVNGHYEIVEWLLKAGADVHARHRDGATPLMLARAKGHAGIVEQLLAKGAW